MIWKLNTKHVWLCDMILCKTAITSFTELSQTSLWHKLSLLSHRVWQCVCLRRGGKKKSEKKNGYRKTDGTVAVSRVFWYVHDVGAPKLRKWIQTQNTNTNTASQVTHVLIFLLFMIIMNIWRLHSSVTSVAVIT